MNDIDTLLEQARTLGQAIAGHARVKAFVDAQNAASKDPDAMRLSNDYQQQAERLHTLESQHKPVEVADKHKLRDLQAAVAGNDALKQLMRAQADYLELMSRVQDAMDTPMAEAVNRA